MMMMMIIIEGAVKCHTCDLIDLLQRVISVDIR